MRKKILFIIGTLQSGGVSKSLVSLLNAIDRERYDVRLLVLCFEGDVFSTYLPTGIKLYTNPTIDDLHRDLRGVLNLIKRCRFLLAFISLLRMVVSRFSKSLSGEILAKAMPRIADEEFDLIVDYGGQQLLYYMVDKLRAKKKVSFFHSDYRMWPYYYQADKKYFPKVDHIFTISDVCVESLKTFFPTCADKISVMENISSPQTIYKLSEQKVNLPPNKLKLVTLGHFSREKGADLALEAASILYERNIDFVWIFVGKILDNDLFEIVEKGKFKDCIIFKGIQPNPYPYIKTADIFVHPSRFEGKSIALDEAKILCKPIVVTNFSTVNDQFTDGVNASICEMNGPALAEAILNLAENKELREKYTKFLHENIRDNCSEVQKLYKFLE